VLKTQTFGPNRVLLASGQIDAGVGSATAAVAGAEIDVRPAMANAAATKMDGRLNRRLGPGLEVASGRPDLVASLISSSLSRSNELAADARQEIGIARKPPLASARFK
jgi:hypothetical protein